MAGEEPVAFVVHAGDNVATLLADAGPGAPLRINGAGTAGTVDAREAIRGGHKIALGAIAAGEPIVKYGVPIGRATRAIAVGDWVHLHNCASFLDERSGTLDADTGAATDTRYA